MAKHKYSVTYTGPAPAESRVGLGTFKRGEAREVELEAAAAAGLARKRGYRVVGVGKAAAGELEALLNPPEPEAAAEAAPASASAEKAAPKGTAAKAAGKGE